jgi:hypothetical protein
MCPGMSPTELSPTERNQIPQTFSIVSGSGFSQPSLLEAKEMKE